MNPVYAKDDFSIANESVYNIYKNFKKKMIEKKYFNEKNTFYFVYIV